MSLFTLFRNWKEGWGKILKMTIFRDFSTSDRRCVSFRLHTGQCADGNETVPQDFSTIWAIIQPFILKLLKKNVPNSVTKLYENLAKYAQPAIDSLFKLKTKVKETPTELDDYCFEQGVSAIESFANYLLDEVKILRA